MHYSRPLGVARHPFLVLRSKTHTHTEPLTLNMLVFLCLSKFPSKNGHLKHRPSFFFLATFQMNSVPLSVDSLCNSWLHSVGEESGPALEAKGIDNFPSKTEHSKLSLLILFPGFFFFLGDYLFCFSLPSLNTTGFDWN